MDYKDSKIDTLLISESNYSCQLFDESFIKMKNDKNKQIYQLDEKEKDIYEQQEELGRKMLDLISNNQKEFKHKYNLLQKEEDLYHREYNNFNSRISNLLNQYNNYYNQNSYYYNGYNGYNSNFMNLNSLLEVLDDNKWVFPKKEPVNNNKSFRAKCNIKSCEKKIIKKNLNLNNKSYIRSKSKTYRTYRKSTNNSMNNLKIKNNKDKNKDKSKDKDSIINKTERKIKNDFNKNNYRNDKNDKLRAKSRTTRTNTRNSYTSLFEENKINNDKKQEFNYFEVKDNNNNNIDNKIIIKPDYSKYLTRENFYPKSYRIENNKERLTSDEILYQTKTSFRDNRMKKDLYEKAFKKFNYKSNIYNFNDK